MRSFLGSLTQVFVQGAAKQLVFRENTHSVLIQFCNGELALVEVILEVILVVCSGDEPMVVLDSLNDWRFAHNVSHCSSHIYILTLCTPLVAGYSWFSSCTLLCWRATTDAGRVQYWNVSWQGPLITYNIDFLRQACRYG